MAPEPSDPLFLNVLAEAIGIMPLWKVALGWLVIGFGLAFAVIAIVRPKHRGDAIGLTTLIMTTWPFLIAMGAPMLIYAGAGFLIFLVGDAAYRLIELALGPAEARLDEPEEFREF